MTSAERLLAGRYARALFACAAARREEAAVAADLQAGAAALTGALPMLRDPRVGAAKKKSLVREGLQGAAPLTMDFLELLIDKKRFHLLPVVAQDMDNIVRLAKRMEEMPDVHFLFIGAGSEVKRLTALVAGGKARNIKIAPPVEQGGYLSVISQFDVGLISLDRRLRSFSTTGKLLGYLRCGLPVLASVNPGNELMELLPSSGAGLCSWNGDDEAFYQNAVCLCSASVRRSAASRSRVLLEAEFSIQAAADRILASIGAHPGACLEPTANAEAGD